MSNKLQQHFVPKFLFRLYNGGGKSIHLIRKATNDIVFNASIRGQCARHKYYGDQEFEEWLDRLERKHATAIRALREVAWDRSNQLSEEDICDVLEGIMLQRCRVPATAQTFADGAGKMMMYAFREHLKSNWEEGFTDLAVQAINEEKFQLEGMEQESVHLAIDVGLRTVIAISDLKWAVLRNHTDYPLIFGDCPCVFYNKYLYSIKSQGVLGLCTPGLIIFFPIDEHTQLMLYDSVPYRVAGDSLLVDVTQLPDISHLNAMQLHMANECIYFWNSHKADYLVDLVGAHKCHFDAPRSYVGMRKKPIQLEGESHRDGELLHMFDHQLPHVLELSFLETKTLVRGDQVPMSRNEEIAGELRKLTPPGAGRTPIEEIAKDVQTHLEWNEAEAASLDQLRKRSY